MKLKEQITVTDVVLALHDYAITILINKTEDFFGGDYFSSIINEHIDIVLGAIDIIKKSIRDEFPQLEKELEKEENLIIPVLLKFIRMFTIMHYYSLSLLPKEIQKLKEGVLIQSVTFVYVQAFIDKFYDIYKIEWDSGSLSKIAMAFVDKTDDEMIFILEKNFKFFNLPIDIADMLLWELMSEFGRASNAWFKDLGFG